MDNTENMNNRQPYENPFVYNAPVRRIDFCNREEIIKRIFKETVKGRSQGNVWITGERKVGKTSLLRYIQSKYEKYDEKIQLYQENEYFNAAFIYLNTQDNRTHDDFYRNLRQSLKDFFDFKIDDLNDPFGSFIHASKYLFFEQKYYIIFLVDEFDAFVNKLARKDREAAVSFLDELNKLTLGVSDKTNKKKMLGCIYAANRTMEELLKENDIQSNGSGLEVESFELDWFTKEQVNDLAQQYLKDQPIRFSPGEIDLGFKITHGYPYFVQKLFSIMYDQKKPDAKLDLSKIKKEYGRSFKETINGWGGDKLPKRTMEKLKDLSAYIIKNAGDRSLSLIFKGIEEYLKMQLNN
jgi:GTPase SAR1 family protein